MEIFERSGAAAEVYGDDETGLPVKKMLKRESDRFALERLEAVARTMKDFEEILDAWKLRDENRERRERYHEKLYYNPMIAEGITPGNAIIPQPLDHRYWWQMLRGSFLDVIHDCPYDIHEQVADETVSVLLRKLRDNQKEVLYYRAVRQYSAQRIAGMRGQTDRNILKVYGTLLAGMRDKLYDRIFPRFRANRPLAAMHRRFLTAYMAGEFMNDGRD